MKLFTLFLAFVLLTGCAVRDQGTRTLTFGPDGIKVESETLKLSADQLVDIEKEKTRQVCYKQLNKANKDLKEAVKSNPLVLAMWEQTKALNNALSLLATGRPYDPCPGSTNSSDVEIADSRMYETIYKEGFSVVKLGLGVWGITDIFGNLFGAALGGYSLNTAGDINISDSFKESFVGNNSPAGGVFNSKSEEIIEIIEIPE